MADQIWGFQIRAARSILGWTQAELAERAGVGVMTVIRAEATPDDRPVGMRPDRRAAVVAVCEAAGVRFVERGVVRE